ncbi:MAG: pilus assembly protein PilM [Candidatus Brocadiae bacterium]|nr:pilus assembly protein PilM [Candidatus Brocadiia bacterium]
MPKAVWGVDVSKFSIKAARLVPLREGAAEITQLEVIEFPTTQEGADEGTLIKDGLKAFLDKVKLRGESVVVSLPGHTTFNRFIKIPPTEPKKIAQLVKFEAQQHIPFPMDQVVWGYQILEKEYGPGDELELVLFAVKKDIIYQFLSYLQAVDFPCDVLQFSPVALYNFLMHDQDVGTNCFVLDIGAENSDLVVIDGEKFWIRNIPITGNTITKALQQKFQIPLAEAEKLKVTASQSQQAQKIFGVVQPVLRDLVGEIHRSIGYYKSLSKTVRFEKMMLVGNASKTINLQRFLSQNLQIEAMKLAKLNRFSVSNTIPEEQFQNFLPTIGVACGLGLQGMGLARNKINLLPEEEQKKREFAKKKPMYAAAVAVLLAAVGVMYARGGGGAEAWQAAEASAGQVTQQANEIKGRYDSLLDQHEKNKIEPEKLRVMALRRDGTVALMNALCKVLPDNEAKETVDAKQQIWITQVDMVESRSEVLSADDKSMVPKAETNSILVTIEGGVLEQESAEKARTDLSTRLVQPLVESLKTDSRIGLADGGEIEILDLTKAYEKLIPKKDEAASGRFSTSMFGGRKFHRFKVTLTLKPSQMPPTPVPANPGDGDPDGANK